MNTDIKTLFEFLERACGPEVVGHQAAQPSVEAEAKLDRFAKGECDEAERAEVCRLLQLNPTWLRWLAGRVKLARGPGKAVV